MHRAGWKSRLRGRIADTEEQRGDPDWCTLQARPWDRVRFDLEEGVVVATTVAGLLPALDLVHGLAARGVPLRDADGSALVATVAGAGDRLDWAWGGTAGVLNEAVLADLRALGWERVSGR